MKQDILITQEADEIQVAILENGQLAEYYIEREESNKLFGNIYKGRVKTIIPGIDAAFVDIGTGKDGFLYVADALQAPLDMDAELSEESAQKEPEEDEDKGDGSRRGGRKRQRIDEVLKIGQEVIVQVVKEPIRSKGPRLTTQFSIPARYLVMMPGDEKMGISRRISDRAERNRIHAIFDNLEIPNGVGFIIRTNAEGKSEQDFKRDIHYLVQLWKKIHASIEGKRAPVLLHQELGLVERVMRDYVTEEDTKIYVDSEVVYNKLKKFCSVYMPGQNLNVEFEKEQGHLFEKFKIEKEIENTINRTVPLKSGGSIVIEQTECLVAIDVNTGKFTGSRERGLEETVYQTNIEAAHEIARQLRLRDAGGIIVIDFIDMERFSNRRSLSRVFGDVMKRDRAKTHILKMSEFGLIQMTRQRIRPSLESAVYEACPYCKGKGMVKSSVTMAIQAIKEIRRATHESRSRAVHAYVHPDVADRLYNHDQKTLKDLEKQAGARVYVHAEAELHREDINITFTK